MDVTNSEQVSAWLRTWGSRMTESRLMYQIELSTRALAIMDSASHRYSKERRDRYREALATMRGALADLQALRGK